MTKLIVPLVFIFFSCAPTIVISPEKKPLELDLQNLSWTSDQLVSLRGAWGYKFNEFLPPDSLMGKDLPTSYDITGTSKTHSTAPVQMGLTYFYRVKLTEKNRTWGFIIPDCYAAYTFMVNGTVIAQVGTPSLNSRFLKPVVHPATAFIHVPGDVMDIVIHNSNFSKFYGGFTSDILLGWEDTILRESTRSLSFNLLIIGALTIVGLLYTLFYILSKRESYNLYFGLLIWVIALRMILMDQRILVMWTGMEFGLESDLEYATVMSAVILLGLFLKKLFPSPPTNWMFRCIVLLNVLFIIPLPFLTIHEFASLFFYYFYVLLISLGVYLTCLFLAVRKKHRGAGLFLIQTGILGVSGLLDLLNSLGYIRLGYHLGETFFVIIIFQALWLSLNRVRDIQMVETTSFALKQMEEVQTQVLVTTTGELVPLAMKINGIILDLETTAHILNPGQARLFNLMRQSNHRLETLTTNLKSYQEMAISPLELKLYKMDLAELILSAIKNIPSVVCRNRINLHLPSVDFNISGDPQRIKLGLQVLFEYLSNLKMGNPILVEAGHISGQQVWLSLTLWNHGWVETQLTSLFKPFLQPQKNRRSTSGSVLDLPLAKEYLTQSGVQIEALNQGQGARFNLVFPQAKTQLPLWTESVMSDEEKERPQFVTLEETSDFNSSSSEDSLLPGGKLILAVDDEPINLKLLNHQLKCLKLRYKNAVHGQEALDMVKVHNVGIILLDVMMPGIDGIQVLKTLRAKHPREDYQVILVTAKNLASDRKNGLLAGADAYLSKPFELKELNNLVRKHTQRIDWIRPLAPWNIGGVLECSVSFLGPEKLEALDYPIKELKPGKTPKLTTGVRSWETVIRGTRAFLLSRIFTLRDFLESMTDLEKGSSWGVGAGLGVISMDRKTAGDLAFRAWSQNGGILITPDMGSLFSQFPGVALLPYDGNSNSLLLREII